MHSSQELESSMFDIRVGGREQRLVDLFEGFEEQDRLGVVVRRPFGAVGASALITAAVTAFYDIQRARGEEFFIYPDYYLFHVGRPLGDHSALDVWPGHKEVVTPDAPEAILRAINDRAITRLALEDGEPGSAEFDRESLASARNRIRTCLAYAPAGRVRDADVRMASNDVAEGYVRAALDPEGALAEMAGAEDGGGAYAQAVAARAGEIDPETRARLRAQRADVVEDGVAVESYRRIDLDEALGLLAGRPAPVR
jgi:hypothetical protein